MPDDTTAGAAPAVPALPAIPQEDEVGALATLRPMAPALRLLIDPMLYTRCKQLATLMAQDVVFTPKHLVRHPAACFTVITMALNRNIDPQFLAQGTYTTPSGQIGFEGKLVQGILEQSGRFIGAPKFRYVGEWKKVFGKFEKKTSQRGREYLVPTWNKEDADGLGVIVSWQVKGEAEPRYWPGEDQPFYLAQCFPLNSPLWATDPMQQIRYLSLRRFADSSAPGILGGMPFDIDEMADAADAARDITPARPTREDFPATATNGVTDVEEEGGAQLDEEMPIPFDIVDHGGDGTEEYTIERAAEAFYQVLETAVRERGADGLQAVLENNTELFQRLRESGRDDICKQFEQEIEAQRKALAPAAAVASKAEQNTPAAATAAPAPAAKPAAPPPDRRPRAEPSPPPNPGPTAGPDRGQSPLWKDEIYAVNIPTKPGSMQRDRLAYDTTMLTLIDDAPNLDALEKLITDNATGLRWMRDIGADADITDAIKRRREEG